MSLLIAAVVLSTASATIGFIYGAASARELTIPAGIEPENTDLSSDVIHAEEEEEDGQSIADGDLSAITAGFMKPCKLVLVVRTDLKMTPGEIAAQCSHATLACYKALVQKNPGLIQHWETTGQAKIALKASSEDELLELEAIAKSLNLCARAIEDAGRTQVDPGSRTVLGIGPAPVELINRVTGHLRLL